MTQRNLILLAVGLTVLAFVAAEADFWDEHRPRGHYSYNSTFFTSFRIAHDGEIELDRDSTEIVRMSPDAYLEISERRLATRRRFEARPDPNGKPVYKLREGARERSESEAKEYLGSVMEKVSNRTTVGARARAQRLLSEEGLDETLREVERLDLNSVRRIYLQEAALMDGLDEAGARSIVRTAGAEMSSSTRLRALLVDLAADLPEEWALTEEFAWSAEQIASGSEKSKALVEIVRLRQVQPGDEAAVSEALSTIASSSDKGRAIVRIARLNPTPGQLEGLLDAADTIAASAERRRVLVEVVTSPGASPEIVEHALEVGRGIASSSERAAFMAATANVLGEEQETQMHYIDAASEIAASVEVRRALGALMRAQELSPEVCAAWIDASAEIPASSIATDLLVEASSGCPDATAVWRRYVAAVREIPSSSEQRRALVALLARDGLDEELLSEIDSAAGRIASQSERERVREVKAERYPG